MAKSYEDFANTTTRSDLKNSKNCERRADLLDYAPLLKEQ